MKKFITTEKQILKNIRIAFIIPSLRHGGTQRFIINLLNHINKNLFDIHLIILDNSKGIQFKNEQINIYNLKAKRVRNSIFRLVKMIKKVDPEIIFTLQSHLSIYVILFKFLFKRKIKYVCRESNIPSQKNLDYRFPAIYNLLYKFTISRFDMLICQSNDMYDDLIKNYKINQRILIKINNLIDTKLVNNLSNEKCLDEFQYDFILCASTLSPQKGIDRLIDIVNLDNFKNNIKVAILGEGPLKEIYQRKILKLGLDQNIKFYGLQNNPYKWIKRSKVYLLTSLFEGFPNVLLEAGILRKPSVCFDIKGGISEIIIDGKNGFKIKDGDYKNFLEKMILSRDKKFDFNFIYNNIIEKYSPEVITKKYENLLLNLIN